MHARSLSRTLDVIIYPRETKEPQILLNYLSIMATVPTLQLLADISWGSWLILATDYFFNQLLLIKKVTWGTALKWVSTKQPHRRWALFVHNVRPAWLNKLIKMEPTFITSWKLRWRRAKSVRLWSCRLGFDSESGQTNHFKIGIHSFPAWRLALKGQCGKLAGKFTCSAVGKGT